jgi:hypothetical protein
MYVIQNGAKVPIRFDSSNLSATDALSAPIVAPTLHRFVVGIIVFMILLGLILLYQHRL